MDENKTILGEYTDPSTTPDRKEEIKSRILAGDNEDDKILLRLLDAKEEAPKMQAFQQRLQHLTPEKRSWTPLRIAASISLLIVAALAGYTLLNSKNQTINEAFAAYYVPYDGYVNTRGAAENEITKGISAYEQANYQEALNFFLGTEADSTNANQLNLLISSCYLSLDNPSTSLAYLNKIDGDQSKLITLNRDWYKSLSYLSLGQLDESQTLLQELKATKSPLAAKANSLLSESVFSD